MLTLEYTLRKNSNPTHTNIYIYTNVQSHRAQILPVKNYHRSEEAQSR